MSALGLSAQNNCNNALPATAGVIYNASFSNGSQIPPSICTEGINNDISKGVWYKYTAQATASITVTTDIPGYPLMDTRVHIYSGNCANLMCVAGDDDAGAANSSYVSFNVTTGTTYYIVFDDNWSDDPFSFRITEGAVNPTMFTAMPITLGGSYKLCVVDMNGDYLDDIVSPDNNSIHVLYQNNDGGFTPATLPAGNTNNMPSWSMAAGDFDKNGFNDLLYGDGNAIAMLFANEDGTEYTVMESDPMIYIFSQRTNCIDINNDGNLDAFICHDVEPNVYYINDGEGGFTFNQGGLGDHTNGGNYGSIWVDYDNDGDQDLFIAKCRGGENSAAIDELHRNNGDGTFTAVADQFLDDANLAGGFHQSWSSAWADFDNDGDMDVMIGASSDTEGGHRLMKNNGDGTFTNVTDGSGYDTFTSLNIEHVAHDFNNDGFVDVMSGGNRLMLNNGDMTFSPANVPFTNGPVGDLNNDGFLDVQNYNTVYLNGGNDNNWIKIHLEGVESNRNGIGARVEIYGTWGKQIRDVRSGDGFKFMSSLNTHFGIGEAEEIEKVIVRWPSGTVDGIFNPDINEPLHIVEGSAILNTVDAVANEFTLFPNPAKDFLEVSGDHEFTDASIYDLGGRLIKSGKVNGKTIAVQDLAKGTYVLVLQDAGGKKYSSKFIKG